ncbi:MAG: cobyrinate a,c-diamide synthase [Deltaproteobacteria bacterium]|nr:cobyrinate a,c-diamide synthase [Deltaproteobacteria bacterium]
MKLSAKPTLRRAFVIAATGSGAGKTTVTLGLMEAMRKQGLIVQPFKAGPDYIDPGFHRAVVKRPSYNLDTWMMGPQGVKRSFSVYSKGAEVAVVEGAMGLFDGRDGISEEGSTGHLAKTLSLPVLLVVNAEKTARSVAAIVKGFENFDPGVKVKWVIFNKVGSRRHFKILSDAVAENSKARVIGYLPKDGALSVPSRHLGLVIQKDINGQTWKGFLKKLSWAVETNINLKGFLKSLPAAKTEGFKEQGLTAAKSPATRIAVALDRAFCFYYEENLDMLRRAGGECVFFSPLKDKRLPCRTSGIYLGGGYPELYAGRLAANSPMRAQIKAASSQGMPVYAECGGLMYLSRILKTIDGKGHAMAGVFPWTAKMLKKRKAIGYREITVRGQCPFLKKGSVLKGHEFHYSEMGGAADPEVRPVYAFKCPDTGKMVHEGFMKASTLASYVHVHFASNPAFASGFVKKCLEFASQKN